MKATGVKTLQDEKLLTKAEAKEIVKCANDIEYFLETYCKIQHPTKGAMFFKLRDYQKEVITALETRDKVLLNFSRQAGKTTTIVGFLLHQAMFIPDLTIATCAHKGSGAKEIMSRIRYMYENIPDFLKPSVLSYNVFDIVFSNSSKIMSQTTTESTYRGHSISILYVDEFSHIKQGVMKEWFKSILPTISAPNTKFIISSTPNGSENKFAELYFKAIRGENDFKAITITNERVPDRGPEFKEAMLKDMSEVEYSQEFECAFLSSSGTLIYSPILESLKSSAPLQETLGMDIYSGIENKRLGVTVDVSEGIGQDYSTIEVFDIDNMEQLAEYKNNTQNISDFTRHFIKILEKLDNMGAKEIYYTVESNPIGQSVLNLLENSSHSILKYADLINESGKKKKGILMTSASKQRGCSKFKSLIESGKLKIHSKNLITELKFFIKSGSSFKAESGMNDDLVMATIIFVLMLEELALFDGEVYDNISKLDTIECVDDIFDDPMPVVF